MTAEKEQTANESQQLQTSVSDESSTDISNKKGDQQNEPFHLDLESLLRPISGEDPAGEFLRFQGTYDRIEEARKEEADLPQGVWERDLKKANWDDARDLCCEALKTRSKDLQIAVWLLESLLHSQGFLGVRQGCEFLIGLCEKYWDRLYPQIDGEDLESRVSPMVWVNEKLYLQLKFIPITQPESIDALPYTWSDWESANYLEQLALKDKDILQDAESEGKITRAKFLGSVMFTSKHFYQTQSEDLAASIGLVRDLEDFLDERCEKQSPSLKQFRDTLEDIYRMVNDFLMEKEEDEGDRMNSELEANHPERLATLNETEHSRNSPVSSSIRSRSDAYRMLSQAADYLLMHEPHSPTPYLVKRAVSWGNMTLNELLQELVSDENDLVQIYRLLGIKGPFIPE
ncbi:MAG: type VI secretion system protein TssA [Planctomycetota bacterium]|jgi:type VI secretion system ImpA family protein